VMNQRIVRLWLDRYRFFPLERSRSKRRTVNCRLICRLQRFGIFTLGNRRRRASRRSCFVNFGLTPLVFFSLLFPPVILIQGLGALNRFVILRRRHLRREYFGLKCSFLLT